MLAAPPELMTVKETAEYLRIPLPTVFYLVQRGQLPAVQIGGRWRIKRSLLDRDILRKDVCEHHALVVVADADLRDMLMRFLKHQNVGRSVVDTAAEGLRHAQMRRFEFAILDASLPALTATDLADNLRKVSPDMPLVLLTGAGDGPVLGGVLNSGPVTVLPKPLNLDQLSQVVRQFAR